MSEDEVSAIIAGLEQLMGALRTNVSQLQAILTAEPEVPGGQPAPA